MEAISWASGEELNYTLRRGNVFYYVYKRFFYFYDVFTFLTFLKFLFERFYIYALCGYICDRRRPKLTVLATVDVRPTTVTRAFSFAYSVTRVRQPVARVRLRQPMLVFVPLWVSLEKKTSSNCCTAALAVYLLLLVLPVICMLSAWP